MTLVLAAQGDNFVVAGTDSKGTVQGAEGNVQLNLTQKMFKVNEHVVILLYNDVERAQYLIDELGMRNMYDPNSGVRHVADQLGSLCRQDARLTSDIETGEDSVFGFIVAGLDQANGVYSVPRCYTIDSERRFAVGLARDGFAMRGKPMLAYYNFAKKYTQMRGSKETLLKLVAQSLHDTIQVDGDVGGTIKLATIDATEARVIDDAVVVRGFIDDPWVNR